MVGAVRRVWVLVLGGLIGGGFYFLLIDITGLPELYTLAGAAAAGGVTMLLAREQGFVEARVLPWWVLRGWRLLYKIPQDIGILCWEAANQLTSPRAARGSFRAHHFGACASNPTDAGRRALAELLGSVSPNTIVIGVDVDRRLLLVHQLRRSGAPQDLDVTGLG